MLEAWLKFLLPRADRQPWEMECKLEQPQECTNYNGVGSGLCIAPEYKECKCSQLPSPDCFEINVTSDLTTSPSTVRNNPNSDLMWMHFYWLRFIPALSCLSMYYNGICHKGSDSDNLTHVECRYSVSGLTQVSGTTHKVLLSMSGSSSDWLFRSLQDGWVQPIMWKNNTM